MEALKSKFKKNKLRVVLFSLLTILALFAFTGCGTQEYSIQINDDDSVVFSTKIAVPKEIYNSMAEMYAVDFDKLNREKNVSDEALQSIDALFQETAALFMQYDFSISAIDDALNVGFEATKTYPNLEAFNEEMATLEYHNIIGLDVEIIKSETRYKTTYTCQGNLTYVLDPDIDMENEEIRNNFQAIYPNKDSLESRLSITIPMSTTLDATNGTFENNAYVWTANYNNGEPEKVGFGIRSYITNIKAYIYTGIIILVVVAVLVVIISRFIRKKKAGKFEEYVDEYYHGD